MNAEQQHAILAIGLYAAFADGIKDDREREEIRRVAASLADGTASADLSRLYQDVLLKRITLEAAAATLTEPDHCQLAYEVAVCICDIDGRQSDAEKRFLADLKGLLHLGSAQTEAFDHEAERIVEWGENAPSAADLPVASVPRGESPPRAGTASDADLDKTILNYALLNGALELLPQSWASMAIIPFQIKMVYGIGQSYGVSLDQGHIKEFIAAAGVGLTSQYLEQFGRKLLGGLLGKVAGKTIGKLGGTATGMAFSFATTYALGQLAKRYYAGGRVMNSELLRDTYQSLLGPAKQLQTQYLPMIQEKAGTLDATQIMKQMASGHQNAAKL